MILTNLCHSLQQFFFLYKDLYFRYFNIFNNFHIFIFFFRIPFQVSQDITELIPHLSFELFKHIFQLNRIHPSRQHAESQQGATTSNFGDVFTNKNQQVYNSIPTQLEQVLFNCEPKTQSTTPQPRCSCLDKSTKLNHDPNKVNIL